MIRLIICAGLGIAGAATCVAAHSHNKREREEYERKNEEYLEALKEYEDHNRCYKPSRPDEPATVPVAGGLAVTREVSGKFDTVTMLTDRSQFTKAVQKALAEKWDGMGLTVEQVSVQDVRYPKNITKSYSEAQAAEVAKQKAQNKQETARSRPKPRRSRRRARLTPTPSSRTPSTRTLSSRTTSTRSRASARTATSSSCPRTPRRSSTSSKEAEIDSL